PKGPYRFCSFCRASKLNWEIARQLIEQGETIEIMILIDSVWGKQPSSRYRHLENLKKIGPSYLIEKLQYLPKARYKWLRRRVLAKFKREKTQPYQRDPYHFQLIKNPQHEVSAYNPFCGDKYTIQFTNENQAYFQGIGCAISKASTSLLLQRIEGMSGAEIIAYCQQFLQALGEDQPVEDEELAVLVALKHFDGRMDCITLPWKALQDYFTELAE
ncbi:MAG: iron-sulfur cluster assembly scaffold protein, partial [Bacteroidota bacterium]